MGFVFEVLLGFVSRVLSVWGRPHPTPVVTLQVGRGLTNTLHCGFGWLYGAQQGNKRIFFAPDDIQKQQKHAKDAALRKCFWGMFLGALT